MSKPYRICWTGFYSLEYASDAEKYSFRIEVDFDNGSFQGTAYEELFSAQTGDLVEVKGFIDEGFMSFIKTYPYYFDIDDHGVWHFDKSRLGHQVHYEGNLDVVQAKWLGDWEVKMEDVKETLSIALHSAVYVNGPWEMWHE